MENGLGRGISGASLLAFGYALAAIPASVAGQDAAVPDLSQDTAWHNRQMLALAERQGATGWHVTASGLRWRRIAGNGSGTRPGPSDEVTVHYVGTFSDGAEFDSSVKRGEPATFPLNRVIRGWQEGVQLMGIGDKVEFAIPQELGYGPKGRSPIPGGATLLFTVELIAIDPAGGS
ncbi:FKBP-type peptidyl-prolyl cis-trans isomerase [Sphingomonas sp. BT-65]|uniref:FKBP-type peptidyl-prolyl cis-trans isomerase n=1 Tax=Sphingomonas sp. BT-65 TaxID=2989821 RepID=UPI00223629ED|nr:FKBP-type peptidyl-prolyl cis-trans isomerase [Sphingomonas sp. BT-65]MCW4460540.1 FKBP-type peptidyl-prolyl cis-trans isomerase [Sphingomonas sp. BT-65]